MTAEAGCTCTSTSLPDGGCGTIPACPTSPSASTSSPVTLSTVETSQCGWRTPSSTPRGSATPLAIGATARPTAGSWITLGALASETEDLELGMLVTNLAWRDPVHVARFAMSVDQLSNGRFVLGLGCGQVDDQLMVGRPTYEMPNKEQVDRLEEGTRVIDRLFVVT